MINPVPAHWERERLLPRAVWDRMSARAQRLFVLDYDGTLAPLHEERADARLSPEMRGALMDLASTPGTRVVIVSGRPTSELRELLDGTPLPLVGEHGWEEWTAASGRLEYALDSRVVRHLDRAVELVPCANDLVERKRCSVVLHTRSLDSLDAAAAEDAAIALWEPLAIPGALQLDVIRGGVELRAVERDKGVATRELLRRSPPDTLPIVIGDDVTDESAFREVDGRGITIRVGMGGAVTAAHWRVPGVADVLDLLRAYHRRERAAGATA